MGKRPEFCSIKTFEEFSKYYWYREELIKICRSLGLKSDGGKIELNGVIKSYFAGEKILPQIKQHGKKEAAFCKEFSASCKKSTKGKSVCELSLKTGLIECGFTFGNRFREFFASQTGIQKFKFNADMVATVKKVKESGDTNFTLGDLLDVYYGKKIYAKYDKSALQWNKFVKDFCADQATAIFSERLKAAAALWKIVRESDMPKVYSHELFIRRYYAETTEQRGAFKSCE